MFKLLNPGKNLAGLNPIPVAQSLTAWFSMITKWVLAFCLEKANVAGVIFTLVLLIIIIYHKDTIWEANRKKKAILLSSPQDQANSEKKDILPPPSSSSSQGSYRQTNSKKKDILPPSSSSSSSSSQGLYRQANSSKKDILPSSSKELCRRFSFNRIKSATQNFDETLVVGKGGFGKVYKGLIGANTVAIKRLNTTSTQGADEFWTEIEMLSQFRHNHLVPPIGYCNHRKEMILVYEFMANGTLADHLYEKGRNEDSPLTWEQRLNICIGAARGLEYLHGGMNGKHSIVHRDVKSSNILLDENWVAKISDFGLSKMGFVHESSSTTSTCVRGTFGYFDPEYVDTGMLTMKSDVFAFGVVLLEVLSGKPPTDAKRGERQHSLAVWGQRCIKDGTIDKIIDQSLIGKISSLGLQVFIENVDKCLRKSSNERPTMSDVVSSLKFACALESWGLSTQEDEFIDIQGAPPQGTCPRFSLLEIREATKNFDDNLIIGYGEFSKVYKGDMKGGMVVAIKRLNRKRNIKEHEFCKEITRLTQHRNRHVVPLIGYCCDEFERILVYDYMVHGTLRENLLDLKNNPIPWKQRLQICIDVARGLNYLHTGGVGSKIIHRNIKLTNILLDEERVARVSDYGLSFLGPNRAITDGKTFAVEKWLKYFDPECAMGFVPLTEKSDVYSFGLVLLEVLCAREDTQVLLGRVKSSIREKALEKIVDPCLRWKIGARCMKEFLEIALSCILDRGTERPTMCHVVERLEYALQQQEIAFDHAQGRHFDLQFIYENLSSHPALD